MQESILEQIKAKVASESFATVITDVGQKYYIEEYHEYNERDNTYGANDENGNEVLIKLTHIRVMD